MSDMDEQKHELTPEQARNMLIIGGWIPLVGARARHPVTLNVVSGGDLEMWTGSPDGGFASGRWDVEDWKDEDVVYLFETIERLQNESR